MENVEKKIITENLRHYVAKYPSQNKAAGSLQGIRFYSYLYGIETMGHAERLREYHVLLVPLWN